MANGTLDPQAAASMRANIEQLRAMVEAGGPGVLEAVDAKNRAAIVAGWKEIGAAQTDRTIETFVNVLWETMCRPDGLQFTAAVEPGKMQMHCTYCPWVEVAKAAGSTEIGFHLLCKSDEAMIAGFNQAAGPGEKQIVFTRTKTLMQGDDYCDHTYTYAAGSTLPTPSSIRTE